MKFAPRKSAHLTCRVAALSMFALLTCAGCATSMSYSTSPQTLEPGEVSGGIAGQFSLNTTVVDKGIDTLKIAGYYATDSDDLTEEEYRELLDAVVAYALFRPSVAGEVAMRVGVFEGADVGIRYNASILKGDAKVRVWQSPDESSVVSVTAGIGQGGSLGPSNLKYITWQEFSRLDAELSIMYGYEEADFFRVYAGPRLIHTWLTVDPVLSPELLERIPEEYQKYRPDQYFRDENILYLGGTIGTMIGYKWIWLHLEATVMYTLFNPLILDRKRNLSGFTVAPVAGISVEF